MAKTENQADSAVKGIDSRRKADMVAEEAGRKARAEAAARGENRPRPVAPKGWSRPATATGKRPGAAAISSLIVVELGPEGAGQDLGDGGADIGALVDDAVHGL